MALRNDRKLFVHSQIYSLISLVEFLIILKKARKLNKQMWKRVAILSSKWKCMRLLNKPSKNREERFVIMSIRCHDHFPREECMM